MSRLRDAIKSNAIAFKIFRPIVAAARRTKAFLHANTTGRFGRFRQKQAEQFMAMWFATFLRDVPSPLIVKVGANDGVS
jgi:hypothetical protein